jgi:hypothetical protein
MDSWRNQVENSINLTQRSVNRRSVLRGGVLTGGAALGAGLLSDSIKSFADSGRPLNRGDVAILQFLAAAEIIESDLWTQYAELGGIGNNPPIEVDPNETLNPYQSALSNLDPDGPQYITSNTLDEVSHAEFLNAYLESKGAEPVDLDAFRNLQGSTATGAQNIGRLTNLMHLNVDTSWFVRYRSSTNPDFGATFPQAVTISNRSAIPVSDADMNGSAAHLQVLANIAAFHFGTIEQGGTSLYAAMSRKASHEQVLEITLSIGGDEIAHFLEWVDFAGNGVQQPVAPVSDGGLTFPDFFNNPPLSPATLVQPSLIFPVPCEFISPRLPKAAIIRPVHDKFAGARAAVEFLTNMNLFAGQPNAFFRKLQQLGDAADAAQRQL